MRFLFALAVGCALCAPGLADDPVPAKRPDPTAELLAKLAKPVDFAKANDLGFEAFLDLLQEKFGVTAVLNERAFRAAGIAESREGRLKIAARKGIPLGVTTREILDQMDATYLVRRGHIEIVPIAFAAQETKNAADDTNGSMKEPLVSMIVKEKAFNEAVAELAEENGLTVIVSPQSGDARMGFVTARLLNVPADKALELLAVQCDLRVLRKGNTFLITSRDHANDLFNERQERERQKIETERLRGEIGQPRLPIPAVPPEPKQEK